MAEADEKPQNETVWFFIPLGFGFVDRISAKLGFDGGKQRFYRLDLYILMISMFDRILDSSLLLSLVKISVFHLSSSPVAGFLIDQIYFFVPEIYSYFFRLFLCFFFSNIGFEVFLSR